MTRIAIDGEIGWDVTSDMVREQLDELNDDVMLEISSPGGSVYQAFSIFSMLRDYKKKNNRIINVKILGLAASAASYIAMVGDNIQVSDNSVFMIHYVWGITIGNHLEMRKTANIFEQLSNVSVQQYAKRSGKSEDEIRELMKEESYFFGRNIVDEGFADEVIDGDGESEANQIMLARMRIDDCIKHMNDDTMKEDASKAVALLGNMSKNPLYEGNNNEGENLNMKLSEFLEKNPEAKAEQEALIDSAKAEAVKDAVQKQVNEQITAERANMKKIVELSGGTLNKNALECIEKGKTPEQYALMEMEEQKKKNAENPQNLGEFNTKTEIVPEKTEEDEVKQKNINKVDEVYDKMYAKKEDK
jgi:ATP-dependent protease ClpP protease subunit